MNAARRVASGRPCHDREDEVVEGASGLVEAAGDPALPKTRPEDAAQPEREEALHRVVPDRLGVFPRVQPGADPVHLVARQPDDDRAQPGDALIIEPRWNVFAPATNHIVKAVSVMTMVVPRSGSLKTSAMTGTAISRNGTVPAQNRPTRTPRFGGNQCARYTISASFAISAGSDRRQRAELNQRADPPTTMLNSSTNTRTSNPIARTYPGIDTRRR